MSSTVQRGSGMPPVRTGRVRAQIGLLIGGAAAFGFSATITIVFNMLLAWIKDAMPMIR
jgi:hypothetical protein